MSAVSSTGQAMPAGGGVPAATDIETRIARLLTIGTRIGIALLAVGSVLMLAAGISPLDSGWAPLDVAALPSQLVALRPEAFLWLGLIVTIATPLLRVSAATLGFARAGERRMVFLGIAVLVVIALAIAAGVAGS